MIDEEANRYCRVDSIEGFSSLLDTTGRTQTNAVRFGSTLLLSGPPGAGKTTFALALVRSMMAHVSRERERGKTRAEAQGNQRANSNCPGKTLAYYIGSEIDAEQLQKNFREFGWFKSSQLELPCFQFAMDQQHPDSTNFYCITQLLEVDRPVPSPEELVNGIFNRIVHTLAPSESPAEDAYIYVIIDSITALLKGCEHPGEERRQTHEIMRRLEDRFGRKNLALTVLLAEQDHRSQNQDAPVATYASTGPSVEDYLADIVFRLYVRNLPLGRRARILEVVKSQGAYIATGEHTWQIISESNCSPLLQEPFKLDVEKKCGAFVLNQAGDVVKKFDTWGGVIIFPRPRVYGVVKKAQNEEEGGSPSHAKELATAPGVPKSDESATKLDPGTVGLEVDVSSGKVTLIAGPMGCGKTTLCRQFLNAANERTKAYLISFESPTAGPTGTDKFETLYFTQAQYDLNVLIAHLECILVKGCERLAFDGLSEWITTFDRPEAARILEVLMATVRRKREDVQPPSVFMTYEMQLDHDPLAPAALGANADNVLVVRQVAINDELRKLIYQVKPWSEIDNQRGQPSHQHPAELRRLDGTPFKLEVDKTSLEAFTGLLRRTGEVLPAKVLVQLFKENDAEGAFNAKLQKELNRQFRQRVRMTYTDFSLSDLGSTLETAFGVLKPSDSFNLAILSIDEWWLTSQKSPKFLKSLQSRPTTGPNYRDFWWFEVEKGLVKAAETSLSETDASNSKKEQEQATAGASSAEAAQQSADAAEAADSEGKATTGLQQPAPPPPQPQHKEPSPKKNWHAIPAYLDFGLFCINLNAMVKTERQRYSDSGHSGKIWRKLLANVPRLWVKQNDNWFDLGTTSDYEKTVLSFALHVTGQIENGQWRTNHKRKAVFHFDSSTRETCSCLFFELAWAFGACEAFLASDSDSPDYQAARRALLFLQFMVAEGLMPARASIASLNHDRQPILFSRHWQSSLQRFRELVPSKTGENPAQPKTGENPGQQELFALPFMPTGQSEPEKLAESLLDDIEVRQDRLLERARDFASSKDEVDKLLKAVKDARKQVISLEDRVAAALVAYQSTHEWLLTRANHAKAIEENDEHPEKWSADIDDLIELSAWSALRLQLLLGRDSGRFPEKDQQESPGADGMLFYTKWVRHLLPQLSSLTDKKFNPQHVIATGYVCSGAWMFGVNEKSRSAELQAQMLATLTSLDMAEERAQSGAGMPARKDFFYLKGENPVPKMEYLNWRALLRYCGARARRRDRIMGDVELADPTTLYSTIHQELLACLRVADLERQSYARDPQPAVQKMNERADAAIKEIWKAAKAKGKRS